MLFLRWTLELIEFGSYSSVTFLSLLMINYLNSNSYLSSEHGDDIYLIGLF